jgi:hypothetical protein
VPCQTGWSGSPSLKTTCTLAPIEGGV